MPTVRRFIAIPVTLSNSSPGTLVQSRKPEDAAKNIDISGEDLLLASTVVFGFSLSDKVWCEHGLSFSSFSFQLNYPDAPTVEFDVENIQDVEWNEDAFANLVLPSDRKHLLQSLVEAHHQELGFDDFIKGKGHGLVVNLFGPPGVGMCPSFVCACINTDNAYFPFDR